MPLLRQKKKELDKTSFLIFIKMERGDKQKMHKQGYCKIEKRITWFRKLPNGKWLCESSNCSMTSGQCKEVPPIPKKIYPTKFKFGDV